MHRIPVDTPSKNYEVYVGQGLLSSVGSYVRDICGGSSAHIISDSTVKPLYGAQVKRSLENHGYSVSGSFFTAGEASKTIDVWASALNSMAAQELDRNDCVIALGGGVVGDLAGFAAATYMRGIQVVQIPTTLLAMVDSSVGGKTAVDIDAGKNLVGAFMQPSLVVADTETLKSLDPKLIQDASGEIIKHAVLADAYLLEELIAHPITEGPLDLERMDKIVYKNVRIKRDVVMSDEREKGARQTLNLGHTIGHAIEAASHYTLGHGACVAAGLCCMARACEKLMWTSPYTCDSIIKCVSAHGLATNTEIDPNTLFSYVVHDKKRHGNTINIIVPAEIEGCIIKTISLNEFLEVLELGCSCD